MNQLTLALMAPALGFTGQGAYSGAVYSNKVNYTDIVNSLTSTATDKPLSAAQGKALNEAIQQITATVHSVNVNGASIIAYRVGNTVFFSCVGGTYECPSDGSYVRVAGSSTPLSQLPVGYRPVGYVDIKDNLTQKRLVMAPSSDASTGRFTGTEAFTSAALRFSATWVTTDPMPT